MNVTFRLKRLRKPARLPIPNNMAKRISRLLQLFSRQMPVLGGQASNQIACTNHLVAQRILEFIRSRGFWSAGVR
jgi:hypothetical protein